jgi:upstream activation factor subunit UAF30
VPEPLRTNDVTSATTNGVHKFSEESADATPSAVSSPAKRGATEDSLSDVVDDAPPKKKRRPVVEEDDAAIAARLQAEEDRRSRPTRGGATRKAAPSKKKTPKKKSKAKIGSEEDSDIEGEDRPKKPKSNTGFHVRVPLLRRMIVLTCLLETTRPVTTVICPPR